MKIELKEITVKELSNGYKDNAENGVVGFGGKLDIRPQYQREFIYKVKQRDAVIDTIKKGFPLNVMYWAVCEDGKYEVIDGQQRTISICQYINGDFAFDMRYIHNLQDDEKEQILNYKLMIYLCEGAPSEKLKWFETINIAGEKLTDQELRNAVYSGAWVTDAKRWFSKTTCPAYQIGQKYLNGSPIRQDYLETAIDWISEGGIKEYMAIHQHDQNASPLWRYFQSVITWTQGVFPEYRKEMKGVAWGELYNKFKDKTYNTEKLEKEVGKLMQDDDITKKSGIYAYLLDGQEKHLSIRAFTDNMKREAYEKQKGVCVKCGDTFEINEMEADHVKPWAKGGKTISENCQMLCRDCNRAKSDK